MRKNSQNCEFISHSFVRKSERANNELNHQNVKWNVLFVYLSCGHSKCQRTMNYDIFILKYQGYFKWNNDDKKVCEFVHFNVFERQKPSKGHT